MANYYCNTRTNYFRVTDEEKYKELFAHLVGGEDDVHDFTETDTNGVVRHGFGAYSSIYYKATETDKDDDDDDEAYSISGFVKGLQEILPNDEAFIMMEVGNEKLRYVVGWAVVATKNNVQYVSLQQHCIKLAQEMLGDDKFTTVCEY